ncbi:hypothetical protein SK128_017810 [Halocaridina rubra]|uniref:RRM domain-containing protein n=1 Tax=Halocaridina rubra TaxID=373956 RepID=A0AAN8XIQ5_HALRR
MVTEPIKVENMETTTAATSSGFEKLDMTLSDIIKANKIKQKVGRGGKVRGRGGSRGRGNNRGRGIIRKQGGGGIQKGRGAKGGQRGAMRGQRGGMRGMQRGRGRGNIQLSTLRANANQGFQKAITSGPAKLHISNLDPGVSDSDIFELFAEFGTINEAAVHYDRLGRSVSTAHVAFARHVDAVKALKQYNGMNLDGRPMNMSIEVGSAGGRGGIRGGMRGGQRGRILQKSFNVNRSFGSPQRGGMVKRLQNVQVARGGFRGRGGARGMRGRGRGNFAVNVTASYGINKNYNVGLGGRGRGGFRGRGGMRGGRGGRGNQGNRGGRGMRGAGRGGNRGGGRGGKQQKKTPTVEELDADLDSYLNETA